MDSSTDFLDRATSDRQSDMRLRILHLVHEHGSISQAARVAGISYKAAWQAVDTLSNLAGQALVHGSPGGSGGGGARLTEAGQQLLHAAAQIEAARRAVLARLGQSGQPPGSALGVPRTSMRNHLRARVLALHSANAHDPLVRVQLALGEGDNPDLAALITRESAELLALAPGLPVLALCKATAVRVHAADAPPAGNRLSGQISHITPGAGRDEVTLSLAPGPVLVGFAPQPHPLQVGQNACGLLDESALVLALPG